MTAFLGLLALSALQAAGVPDPAPGKEVSIDLAEAAEGRYLLHLPRNYDPARKWPVLYFLPGMGQKTTTAPMVAATEGTDYIVVGVGYAHGGPAEADPKLLDAEQKVFRAVFADVSKRASVDPKGTIVSGFSKGGFLSLCIADAAHPDLAAIVLIGATGSERFRRTVKTYEGLSLYVGSGETDPACPYAKQAARNFGKEGAHVVYEEYAGLGHKMKNDAPLLRDFLRANGPLRNDPAALDAWLTERIEKAAVAGGPAERYLALVDLKEDPRHPHLDRDSKARLEKAVREAARHPKALSELQAELIYLKARELESRSLQAAKPDKRLLVEALQTYRLLLKRHPGTRAAGKGQKPHDAVQQLVNELR